MFVFNVVLPLAVSPHKTGTETVANNVTVRSFSL